MSIVTPWEVKGNIDYRKLTEQFGTELITDAHLERIEKLVGQRPHHFLRRSLFFSHRALDEFLDAYEYGDPVFLYTGRGPTSESLHIGHTISFLFTVWLQKAFKCPVVLQMADDEKYAFKDMPFDEIYRLGFENAKDLIAFGFDPELTFIFSNRDYRINTPEYEVFVSDMKTKISSKEVSNIFGFDRKTTITESALSSKFGFSNEKKTITKDELLKLFDFEQLEQCTEEDFSKGSLEEYQKAQLTRANEKTSITYDEFLNKFNLNPNEQNSTVAMYDWPFYQSAAAFSKSFPHIFGNVKAHCLVAYGIDQDNYFRMARDIAVKMNLIKPYSIMCQFIPPLTGVQGKMSSSTGVSSSIFLTDDVETIKTKVITYAFSGSKGNGSLQDHLKYGGDTETDISFQYLKYFEEDDEKLAKIHKEFSEGSMTCRQIKDLLIEKLVPFCLEHQEKRKTASSMLEQFYEKRPLKLNESKFKIEKTQEEKSLYNVLDFNSLKYTVKYHKPILTMEEGKTISASLNGTVCKNLFMRDADKYFLIIADSNTAVNVKALSKILKCKLKFVDNAGVETLLKVKPGTVSPFTIVNYDGSFDLTIVLYGKIEDEYVNFHPLRNDATLTISHNDLIKFIELYPKVKLETVARL